MEPIIVDRIEGQTAVCEDPSGRHLEIPLQEIRGPVQEGSLLFFSTQEDSYAVDPEATDRRRRELYRKQQALFKGDAPGKGRIVEKE